MCHGKYDLHAIELKRGGVWILYHFDHLYHSRVYVIKAYSTLKLYLKVIGRKSLAI